MNKKMYRDKVPSSIITPACRVRASRTAQDTVNREDTQDHPRSSRSTSERPHNPNHPHHPHHPHRKKGQRTLKPISTNQKPGKLWVSTRTTRVLTSGNQSPRTLTSPGTSSTATRWSPQYPQGYHRICPEQAPPTQHTGKKTKC